LAINIKNFGDMFRFIEPSSDQIQNTVLVHSLRVHMSALTECAHVCTHWMCTCVHSLNVPILRFVFGLMMDQSAETCRRNF